MLEIMQSLWIGKRLSTMERMSINSFLKNGHQFHLYTYGGVENLPDGVQLMDANSIIPAERIFTVRGGYSSFSDFFRWALIRKNGGWWVDTDAICLKPFEFPDEFVFFGGQGKPGSEDCISSGIFKVPAYCVFTEWAWQECRNLDPKTMAWGQAGPPLITEAVNKFSMYDCVWNPKFIFPVYYTRAPHAFTTPDGLSVEEKYHMKQAYSLHWFNEMWRMAGVDKDITYPSGSLYEEMKRKYL